MPKEPTVVELFENINKRLSFIGDFLALQDQVRRLVIEDNKEAVIYLDHTTDGPKLSVREND